LAQKNPFFFFEKLEKKHFHSFFIQAFASANIAAVMKTAGWDGLCRDHPELVGTLIARLRDNPTEEQAANQHWFGYISVAVVVMLFAASLWSLIKN
jgi:Na+/citrate or Na+/malate symporter